jgi:serine/threonine protein kinase
MAFDSVLSAGMEPYPGYRLVQLLGRGGYADVWEASLPDGRKAALKFLNCSDSTAAAREIRSLQALRHLSHPNLIRVEQIFTYRHYIVIQMELAEGSLLDLYEVYHEQFNKPMVPEQVCLFLLDAAEALDFLNLRQHVIDGKRAAVQHCDVKPSNLLFFGEKVKLADFGLSSFTSSKMQFHRKAGTLDYAPPEIFQGRISDRSDQYSLAVTYCHLRGGRLPFSDTPTSFTRSYVRPKPDLTMLDPAERPIVARALDPVPQQRWPSSVEMMQQIAMLFT